MSNYKTGVFQVEKTGVLRPFCPVAAYERLSDISLEKLKESGKKLILLDVDNTLVEWRGEDFSQEVLDWLNKARGLGFQFCILSNTRRPERLKRLSQALGISTVKDRFKPSRRMYHLALKTFDVTPEQAVMVGDQLLTDILGANRSHIEGIWVHRIGKREFIGTRVNRRIEAVILLGLYRYLYTMDDIGEGITQRQGLLAKPIVREFLKFGVVGGTSFVIDTGIAMALRYANHEKLSLAVGNFNIEHFPALFSYANTPQQASLFVFKTISGAVAIMNSFYWNRHWTYDMGHTTEVGKQFSRFVIISVIGLILNASIFTFISTQLLHGHDKLTFLMASVFTMVIVAFWNFGGQKLWAFKKTS